MNMKKTTKDEYLQSIYRVMEYIEANYQENLSLEELASIAKYSKYHFHRIFRSIMGESIYEYIKRVRLSRSANQLYTHTSITSVARESGYETSASFTKAFREYFGCTPTQFSQRILNQKEQVMLKGIEIVEIESIEVLYVRKMGAYSVSAGEAFGALMSFAYEQKIKFKKNLLGKEASIYGIGHDDPSVVEASKLRYDACLSYDDKSVEPSGEVGVKSIEGGKYLKYLHKGSYDGLKEVYTQLMSYVVENELTLADKPFFEKYLNRDPRRTKPENLKTEIYIPIV
jgi:AraC family transcriptional regulator